VGNASITRITETTLPDGAGKTKPAVKVEFKVGTHGPFFETYDKATFDANRAQTDLAAIAQKLGPLTTT